MTEKIITDANGRKYITTEPPLHAACKHPLQVELETLRAVAQQALEALEELRYSSTTFKADKLYAEAKAAITTALKGTV
jgi:hypothetical protein